MNRPSKFVHNDFCYSLTLYICLERMDCKFDQQTVGYQRYIGFYFLESGGTLNNFRVAFLPTRHQKLLVISNLQNEKAVLDGIFMHYGTGKPFKLSE